MKNKPDFYNQIFSDEEKWIISLFFRESTQKWNDKIGSAKDAFSFATRQGLGSLLYLNEASETMSNEIINYLKSSYISQLSRNVALQSVADDVVNKLQKIGVLSVLLKGNYLIRDIYPDSAMRFMSDIDILIPENKSKEAFLLFGSESEFEKRDKLGHHLPTIKYNGVFVEIHTALIDLNLKYTMPMDVVWESISEDKNGLLSLNPIHLFVYQILHIYYSYRLGACRVGWFYDLKLIIEYYKFDIDSEEIAEFVNNNGFEEPYNFILNYYKVLINNMVVNAKEAVDILKLHNVIIGEKDSSDIKLGYSIALERLRYSKSVKHKFIFLKYILTVDKGNEKMGFFKRLIYILNNIFKVLFRK